MIKYKRIPLDASYDQSSSVTGTALMSFLDTLDDCHCEGTEQQNKELLVLCRKFDLEKILAGLITMSNYDFPLSISTETLTQFLTELREVLSAAKKEEVIQKNLDVVNKTEKAQGCGSDLHFGKENFNER